MADTLNPSTPEQVLDAVKWAAAEEAPLAIDSAGTKRALGRPVNAAQTLTLTGLSGIGLYEPEELVMSAGPGTPMAEIEAALAERGQALAFEPPDLGPLLGAPSAGGTIGGAIATNLSGPRRIKSGAARDHILGVEGVSGRGEAFKSGGRVVKNVTGYDVSKLMTGSYGTLAVLTHVTFKVLPKSQQVGTTLIFGLDDEAAVRAMTVALQCPYEVSAATHLPASLAAESSVSDVAGAAAAVTAIRVEGFGPSVDFRARWLDETLGKMGPIGYLDTDASTAFWTEVRDVRPFVGDGRTVWRLSVSPSEGPAVAARISEALDARYLLDWGGGLIWLSVPAQDDGAAAQVRSSIEAIGGHATLVRGTEAVRASAEVFQPQSPALAALTARIKESFDPRRILNPGRMYAGI